MILKASKHNKQEHHAEKRSSLSAGFKSNQPRKNDLRNQKSLLIFYLTYGRQS